MQDRVMKDRPGQGRHWLSRIKGRYAMRKGEKVPNARPDMEKGQGKKIDKSGHCTPGKQRTRGVTMGGGGTAPRHTSPPLVCQSPTLLTQQQTRGCLECKIMAAAPTGRGSGQVKVKLMIQKVTDVTGKVCTIL